jgi:hypothetical protein
MTTGTTPSSDSSASVAVQASFATSILLERSQRYLLPTGTINPPISGKAAFTGEYTSLMF